MRPILFAACTLYLFSPAITEASEVQRTDYPAVARAINDTLHTWLYDPAELDTPAYRQVEAELEALALRAASDESFITGFRDIWRDGPFSHVEFSRAQQPAADLATYLDTLRIGGGGAQLAWQDDVAILTVKTMMGLDTIEEIDAAFIEVSRHETGALVIDLRENTGGAFAVRPLVAHLLSAPYTAGAFVSRKWNENHERPPTAAEMRALAPWEGWSLTAFWADVQEQPLTGIRFEPVEPVFSGPVYVLTSKRTASAAELATDALKGSGRALVVGEKTAGKMLSQKIFDIHGGFKLMLPIADYYSVKSGRLEGTGIRPDMETKAEEALDTALQQFQKRDR